MPAAPRGPYWTPIGGPYPAPIDIPGFGKFKVKASEERDGRNPSTGATIKIAASNKLTFVPAKALKDTLNK